MDQGTKTKTRSKILNDKEFDELRKQLLPIDLQEHFDKNRKVFDDNTAKFEEFESELSDLKGTEEGKAILGYVTDFAKEQYRIANSVLDHNEMLYLACLFLRKKIEKIETSLAQNGIKIDELLKYNDALRFIDDYIKHSSEDREL